MPVFYCCMLYKIMQINCKIENPNVPLGFLADFPKHFSIDTIHRQSLVKNLI